MKLSVIIPVKQDPRLEVCLRAITEQTLGPDRYETIVVDNGPTEDMRRLAEAFGAGYTVQPTGGAYAARERGARVAAGAVLVFTDSDCRPPPEWLATIERLFADPTCQTLIGPSVSAGSSTVASWVQEIDDARWRALRRVERVAFCDTRNLAMRREVLSMVPFDPQFRQAGDVDLGQRLYRAGYEIRLEPAVWLAHDNPRSLRVILRRGVRRGRGLALLERKHGTLIGSTGARPLGIGPWDIKEPVLRFGRHPAIRWLAVSLVSVLIVPIMGALWLISRAPAGRSVGRRLFVTFDRLTLLLGRLIG